MNKNSMGAKIIFTAAWILAAVISFQALWYVDTDEPNIATLLILAVYFMSAFKANHRFIEAAKMFPAARKAASRES